MLGLKRHTVEVVDHDPAWAAPAADACHTIRIASEELIVDIQHVGSTSVPGLPAKPILDLAVAVASFDAMPHLIPRLTSLGFLYRGIRAETGGHLFILESTPEVRTIHLHVVLYGSGEWRDYLAFRDTLRGRQDLRAEYSILKRDLARLHPGDPGAYTTAKADFIRRTLAHGFGQ
ncbi:MAG: GrpB family protein [Paludibaculum sp.]